MKPKAKLTFSVLGLLLVATAIALSWRTPAPTIAVPPVPRSDAEYLRAAHWFGSGWAVNFWNTDLESRARSDFEAIRSDGFNTVVLLVPWAGFTASATDGALIESRGRRLLELIRIAESLDLKVVLRVSYAWDALAADSGPRLLRLWTDPAAYQAWLVHLESLWQLAGKEPNLQFGFFSWEDLWAVMSLADADESERLAAAGNTGFRDWLARQHSLAEVSKRYGREFADWKDVFIPARRTPAFKLFLQFVDAAWIERFFLPAQQRFPKLSMEIRIDSDPVWDGEKLLEWHSHEAAWDLPGADWTTLYWSPAMGGENRGETLSPETAAERLRWMLGRVRDGTGAKQIFIGQFLAEDYTPGFENNGRLARDQVDRFLQAAEAPLYDLAGGYGLWTWSDYHHDAIPSPDFSATGPGWNLSEGVHQRDGALHMATGSSIDRIVPKYDYHTPGGPAEARLCVDGQSVSDAAQAVVSDAMTGASLGTLNMDSGRREVCIRFPVADMMRLHLQAESPIQLFRISSIGFTQPTGMRDATGSLKPVANAYRDLNAKLRKAPLLEIASFDDGWMGRSLVVRKHAPAKRHPRLRFRTHLPEAWPVRPQLSISVDGRWLANKSCEDNSTVEIDLPKNDVARQVTVRIDAFPTHRVAGDERTLGCLIPELHIE